MNYWHTFTLWNGSLQFPAYPNMQLQIYYKINFTHVVMKMT
jgi:hypothetical protein